MRKLLSLLAMLISSFSIPIWADSVMPFEAASSATDPDAQMYYIYQPNHQVYVKVSNGNILGNGFSGDQFIFVESGTNGLYYIYDKSCSKFVTYTRTTDPGTSVKQTSSSAVQLVADKTSAKTWRIVQEGSGDTFDIFPGEATGTTANSSTASWNFRGGKDYALNLYRASDTSSSWQIVAQLSAKLNCATRLYAEPGAKFMHKLVGNNKDDVQTVDNLPTGFVINEDRPDYKYITGTAPAVGEYEYTLNLKDGTTETVRLTVSDQLTQPRPLMGVLTWNAFQNHIDENVIIKLAEGFEKFALKDAGYTYMCIDDQWAQSSRNSSGHLQWRTDKFPNYSTLADRIHDMGLKIGIYSDAGSMTCSNAQPGSYGKETVDAQDFVNWGFDLLKYDFCNATGGTTAANAEAAYKAMGDALKTAADAKNKDFLFYMCEWGYRSPWLWGANTGATCWRATDDTRDYWTHPNGGVLEVLNKMKGIWAYQGVNRWNDADMMCIGLHGSGYSSNNNSALGYGDGDSRCTGLTMAEQRSQMALWCMFASPLTHSNNITNLDGKPNTLTGKTVTNPYFRDDLAIILNKELIALDQDPLGQAGEPIYDEADYIVFQKDMEDGSIGLSITNLSGVEKTITVDFRRLSALKSGVTYKMRDLWSHEYVGRDYTNAYLLTVSVPSHDTFVYRIQKASDPDLTWEEPVIPGWEGLENPEPEPEPEEVTYLTASEIRKKAATGRFAILGVTTTGDHYVNGENGTGRVSTSSNLADVREPLANEIVYFVSAGNDQYYIQREDSKKYIKAATDKLSLVESTSEATPFYILGKGETNYGDITAYDQLYADITERPNDLMIRFKNGNNWLNTQGYGATGKLASGTGAWSFQYVRYMGEQGGSSVDPETPAEGEWISEYPQTSTLANPVTYRIHNMGADEGQSKGHNNYVAYNEAYAGKLQHIGGTEADRDVADEFIFIEAAEGVYIYDKTVEKYVKWTDNAEGVINWGTSTVSTCRVVLVDSQADANTWFIVNDENTEGRYDILPTATSQYGWSFMGGTDRAWVVLNLEGKTNRNCKWVFERQGNAGGETTVELIDVAGLKAAASLVDGKFASNTVWYTIANQQTNQTGYISTKYTNGNFLATTNTTKDADATGQWCIIGNANDGYRFYNRAAGPTKVLSNASTSGMVDATATDGTYFEFAERTAGGKIWNIKDFGTATNYWCGSNNKLGHWNDAAAANDNNCRWIFEEVEGTTTPVDPDNNLGAVDVDGSKYPFVLSTSADDLHWHYLTIRGNKYVSYNANTQQFDNSTTAPSGDAGLFAFVPVSENGVKIINKAAGLTKALGGAITNNGKISTVNYADGLEFIYKNNEGHDVFGVVSNANAHVNDVQGHLGFWLDGASATDDGSTFTFTPTEVLVSTNEVKHYYTIRNNNNPNNYAHYAGDNQNLSLGSTRNNQAVFYFTSAGANANGSQLVNIHNYMAEGKTMNDWNVWNSNAAKTWYVKLANGTDAPNDFNIGANDSYANSWNHQAGGVKSWGAGTDKGSAWFLEEVFEKTYTLDLSAADIEGYTLYNNGQGYTDGQQITGFFFDAASFTTDEAGEHPFDGTLTTVDGTLVFGFNEFNTVTPGQRPADISEYALWYDEPATKTSASDKWMEYALPLGNGQIGATFLGGLMTDNVQFNEKTLWRGGPGRGADGGQGYFQNFGSILVRDLSGAFSASSDAKPATGYARYLDIMNGVGGVRYNSATTQYKRNYFTSAPDKVLVAHYTAEGTDKLNLLFSYAPDTQINASAVTYDGAEATFSGKLHVVKYNTRFRVLSDGDVTRTEDGIKVANGTYATLVMAAATDYDAAKPGSVTGESAEQLATRVSDRLGAAAAKSYDELLAAHVANFSGLMGRVDIDFGGETSQKTTEELIKFYNQSDDNKLSADGLYLEQLYFQYGRYMTIGANNDLSIHAPSNLQGIWNDRSNSNFWHCDVHADINVEMNYWPADPTNLSEMHRPFLDHILDMAREDGPWSQLTHGNPGWTIDCENNIFGGTSGWSQNDMKTLGAWYCSHLWRYYRYTKDREFLKKALPVMYRNAVYLKSIATLDTDNTYVIPGEWSPEHSDFNTITAFAQQTTAEVCDEIIKAHAELGTESTLTDAQVAEISAFYDKLDKGIKIENYTFTRAGKTYTNVPCIAEWKKIALKDPGHRHLSHLMCIYPFEQISAYDEADAANFAAARNGILARTGDVTGWSMGWQTNVYARCLWGNEARGYLSQALRHSPNYGIAMGGDGGCYYNLFDAHSPFQIDGNYGCTSGVAEMLVQSYDDKVHLLPALPNAWADGHAKGLKAIGNFTVDQEWANGELTSADITSNVGGKLEVVYGSKKATIENTRRGETYHFDIKNGQLDYNLVDATIVTITDYIEDAQNGTSYDAQKIEEYKNLILKLQK